MRYLPSAKFRPSPRARVRCAGLRSLPASLCAAAMLAVSGCVTPAEPTPPASATALSEAANTAPGNPADVPGTNPVGGAKRGVAAASARVVEPNFLDLAPYRAAQAPLPAAPDGKYLATFYTPFAGPFFVYMEAEPLENGAAFKANTRPGVAWKKISGSDAAIGFFLAPFLFPGGMILHLRGTVPAPAPNIMPSAASTPSVEPAASFPETVDKTPFSVGEGFIGVATLSALRVKLQMPASGPGRIIVQDDKPIAFFTLSPREPVGELVSADGAAPQPVVNPGPAYSALISQFATLSQTVWFDAGNGTGGARSPAFRSFLTDAQALVADAQDDLEFLFSVAAAWRRQKDLPFPLIYRPLRGDISKILAILGVSDAPFRPLEVKLEGGVALITAAALIDTPSIDVAFEQVVKQAAAASDGKPLRGIVLDLQNCPGVDLAALHVARWLIDRPVDAGVWFGAAARDAAIAGTLQPRRITISSAADFAAAEAELRSVGAVAITLEPLPAESAVSRAALAGLPLAVLHSRRTVTSAESLAAVLQLWRGQLRESQGPADVARGGRIRFIGEQTGKRPQLTRELPLAPGPSPTMFDTGWAVRMPVYDWRPSASLVRANPTTAEFVQRGDAEPAAPPQLTPWKGCDPDETASRDEAIKVGKAFVRRAAGR